jgi:predicted ester cyclase
MSEANKAEYRRFVTEVIGKKNVDAIDEFIDPDFVDHNPAPGLPADREGMKQVMGMFFAAFPDLEETTEFLVAEGDMVVGRHVTRATHTGELFGIPATGKKVEFDEIHIVRLRDGKAIEHWGLSNESALMAQLGVMPPQ